VSAFYAAFLWGDGSWFAREWLRLASVAAIGVLAVSAAQTVGSVDRALRIVVAAAGIPPVVALGPFLRVRPLAAGARAFGTFSHPNAAAATFAFALLMALVLAMRSRKKRDWAMVVLFCAALFTTRSLGGLSAAVIGVWALTHFRLQGVKRALL